LETLVYLSHLERVDFKTFSSFITNKSKSINFTHHLHWKTLKNIELKHFKNIAFVCSDFSAIYILKKYLLLLLAKQCCHTKTDLNAP